MGAGDGVPHRDAGLGKPGVNMGNLQWGCPLDFQFYFPGYSEGGMSGDLENTAMPVSLYQRMPQLPTMTPFQRIPRLDAGGDRRRQGRRLSLGRQVDRAPVRQVRLSGARPCAGADDVQVRRLDPVDHEQHQPLGADVPVAQLEFVVNQSIWFEGEAKFADVILPACTNFERVDISEWAGSAATAITASSSSITASSSSRRRRSRRSASRNPTSGSSTRSASGSDCQLLLEGVNEIDWVKRLYLASDCRR